MGSDGFRRGVARLGPLGLSFDAWLFHTQLDELSALARAFPAQPIVLNHIGGRLALGRYAADPAAVFADWRAGLARLAVHPNVVLKVGGLGMVLAGHAFHERALPPSSEELAAAWAPTLDVVPGAVRRRALHGREQLPGGQSHVQLSGAVERLQAIGRALCPSPSATPCCGAPPHGFTGLRANDSRSYSSMVESAGTAAISSSPPNSASRYFQTWRTATSGDTRPMAQAA